MAGAKNTIKTKPKSATNNIQPNHLVFKHILMVALDSMSAKLSHSSKKFFFGIFTACMRSRVYEFEYMYVYLFFFYSNVVYDKYRSGFFFGGICKIIFIVNFNSMCRSCISLSTDDGRTKASHRMIRTADFKNLIRFTIL